MELTQKILDSITEGVFTMDDQLVETTLNKLKNLGINMIVMDDFGTGYSSLSYLRKYPVDAIKIDRTFIQGLMHNAGDAALVCSIAAMGLGLDLKSIIAEGVEDKSQQSLLSRVGCKEAQGYFFGRPMDKKAMTQFMLHGS